MTPADLEWGVSDFCPSACTLAHFRLLETLCNKEQVGCSPGLLHNQAGSPERGDLLVFVPHGPGRPKGPYLHSVLRCKSKTRCLSSPLFINEASVPIQTLHVYRMEGDGAGGGEDWPWTLGSVAFGHFPPPCHP